MKRFLSSVLPAFLLAVCVGQIYAFTNFASEIALAIGKSVGEVQFAFSLGIFFLGMGAAFFGKIVEKNIRVATIIGTLLFLMGLVVTALGVQIQSLKTVYLGYGVLLGLGTGIIYISPVKTMMMWFPKNRAIAAAIPIVSFGLGSSLSTVILKGLVELGFHVYDQLIWFAVIYLPLMAIGCLLLKKPLEEKKAVNILSEDRCEGGFSYRGLVKDSFFLRSWLFMFLNISCGLCLIPLAKQMMKTEAHGYSEGMIVTIIALCGLFNGGGRLVFAWVSDRLLRERLNILVLILGLSLTVVTLSYIPMFLGITILVINACYGAGFSVIPAILSDNYGMTNISKIHGAVLSAWGVAGLVGNQMAIFVSDYLGFGMRGVVAMLVILYSANLVNVLGLKELKHRGY